MACHTFGTKDVRITMCFPNIYKFPHKGKDFFFEFHNYLGPVAVKKFDLGPRKSIPPGFWGAITKFDQLSKEEKKKYLIAD